jgi:hypothetical protein
MLRLFHHANHLPYGSKDRFVALGLPKINIELPVRRLAAHDSGFEFPCRRLLAPSRSFAILSVHNFACPPVS